MKNVKKLSVNFLEELKNLSDRTIQRRGSDIGFDLEFWNEYTALKSKFEISEPFGMDDFENVDEFLKNMPLPIFLFDSDTTRWLVSDFDETIEEDEAYEIAEEIMEDPRLKDIIWY